MKKLFVSLPMAGKTDEKIAAQMEQAKQSAERCMHEPLELLDTLFDLPDGTPPLAYLAQSIAAMAEADVVYFCDGWEHAKGCRIEWMCARDYCIDRIEACDAALKLRHCPTCGKKMDLEVQENA